MVRGRFSYLVVFASCIAWTSPAPAVVISEIHYHPPVGEESLEFVEVTNEWNTPIDLGGYAFNDGIRFVFPDGTILESGETLVVAADADAIRRHYGIENVVGNFEGRLDGGGERITLVNYAAVEVDSVRYDDDGKWPVGADGSGHSLVLRRIRSDSSEPENWTQSPELGGNPGRRNFPEDRPPDYDVTVFIDVGEEWKYREGREAFSDPPEAWTTPEFDDGAWESGPSGFGFGDDDDNTVFETMRGEFSSIAIRKRIELTEEEVNAPGEFLFSVLYDDGFCAFVNGEQVTGANCPEEIKWDSSADGSHEAREAELFPIPREALVAGLNTIAIVGYNRSIGGNDFSLAPQFIHRVLVSEDAPPPLEGGFNELFRGDDNEGGWVELFNGGDEEYDLAGFRITTSPDLTGVVLGDDARLSPGEFLVVDAEGTELDLSTEIVQFFLIAETGHVAAAAAFDESPPEAAGLATYSEARYPDGGRIGWITPSPTRGAANVVPREERIVINEIFYHPPEDRVGEFIELYNISDEAVDLGGFRFTRGIDLEFPPGTSIGPGEYIVAAEDAQILADHYDVRTPYEYEGRLADRGENVRLVDALGNLVDEVRYHDGGRWSLWADGRGSSLELADPRSDNDFAGAWRASDESEKASWEELSYTVDEYVPAGESELHILLVERGICHIDDVSITRAEGGDNVIRNPGFEEDTAGWRIEGTHVDSVRITEDRHSGEASLRLVATGKGDSTCNRIETDTSPRLTRGAYDVSLWARWQAGSSLLVLHGEFAPGPWFGTRDVNMSNNSLGARLRLTVPRNLGTPGAENTARRILRETTGDDNLGPTIDSVVHSPPSPAELERVRVTARIADPDGIAMARVVFRLDSSQAEDQFAELFDDGEHGDGAPGDGLYAATLPGFDTRARVVFAIEAEDTKGAVTSFPGESPSWCTFRVDGRRPTALQIIQSADSVRELARRPLHSNDLVDATVVFDDSEVYYNVGLRYRGSPWGRPQRASYRVRFAKDRPLGERKGAINVSNRDTNDGVAYGLIGRAGVPGSPAPVPDYDYMPTFINGASFQVPGVFDPVDRDFIEKWYGGDAADGAVVLKGNGRLRFSDACQRTGWDEATLLHMDTSSENYRFYWFHSVNQTADQWEPFMELTRVLDSRETPEEEFEEKVGTVLDTESFFRVLGSRILMNDGDALFVGNGHNGYMTWNPVTGLWGHLAFDMGGGLRNGNVSLLGVRDRSVRRLLNNPRQQRLYYRVIDDIVSRYWSASAGPWLTALQSSPARRGTTLLAIVRQSSDRAKGALRRVVNVDFEILTGDGEPIVSEEPTILLTGQASVQVTTFLVSRNDGDPIEFDPTFTTRGRPNRWEHEFALPDPANRFTFIGLSDSGELLASTTVEVSSMAAPQFVRGDVDGNGSLNVSDPIRTLLHLFVGQEIACRDAADVDDDESLNISDAILLLEYIFRDGTPPAPPFPELGPDSEGEDALGCSSGV